MERCRSGRRFFMGVRGWVLVAVIASVLGITQRHPSSQNSRSDTDFLVLNGELQQLHAFIAAGNGRKATFDLEAARSLRFSAQSLDLAKQMIEATNDIVARVAKSLQELSPGSATRTTIGGPLNIDLSRYPALQDFLTRATEHRRQLESLSEPAQENLLDVERQVTRSLRVLPQIVGINELYAHFDCGYFPNPKPNRTVTNPAATLQSWGYHRDPINDLQPRSGWTRPHTYDWSVCGWDTFRDQAGIFGNQIAEQKYAGWTPPGEPNPEVWRSGPWPYAEWPVYVWWWHQFGPGR